MEPTLKLGRTAPISLTDLSNLQLDSLFSSIFLLVVLFLLNAAAFAPLCV